MTWKPAAGSVPPSSVGCAPSPGSTVTRSKRNCPITPRPLMSRRPRVDYEHATGLYCNELGALPVAAGLRVSEATGADIQALGVERGTGPGRSPARVARSSRSRL